LRALRFSLDLLKTGIHLYPFFAYPLTTSRCGCRSLNLKNPKTSVSKVFQVFHFLTRAETLKHSGKPVASFPALTSSLAAHN
jgi:hypothetical protein